MKDIIKKDTSKNIHTIKVSINKKYDDVLNFYSKDYSLSKLFNVLLEECQNNKSFKFLILKRLSKL